MLTGRGLSERKLNGPGCTVDWVQLRTSTSPQLTVAILNLVQLEDYGATFYSSLFVSYFFVFFYSANFSFLNYLIT